MIEINRGARKFVVFIRHLRQSEMDYVSGAGYVDRISGRGGLTFAFVYEKTWPFQAINEKLLSVGLSACSPLDTFCRKTGRDVAIARAFEAIDDSSAEHPFSMLTKLQSARDILAGSLLDRAQLPWEPNDYLWWDPTENKAMEIGEVFVNYPVVY